MSRGILSNVAAAFDFLESTPPSGEQFTYYGVHTMLFSIQPSPLQSIMRAITIVALISAVSIPESQASCGSGQCNLSSQSGFGDGLQAGHWLVDLSQTYLTVNKPRQGTGGIAAAFVFEEGNSASNIGGEPAVQEISTTSRITTLALTYALTDDWILGFSQPFVDRQHIHIVTPNTATAKTLINPLLGFGDLSLRTHYNFFHGDNGGQLGVAFGIKLATGDDTIPDQEGIRNDSTLQPGSGSINYSFTIDASLPLGDNWRGFGDLTYRLRGVNSFHYSYGNDTLASLGLGWHVSPDIGMSNSVDLTLQVNFRHAPSDKGLITPILVGQRPSTGGNFLYLTPGIRLQHSDGIAVYVFVQLPVYQYVNDQQLTSRYSIRMGLSQAF